MQSFKGTNLFLSLVLMGMSQAQFIDFDEKDEIIEELMPVNTLKNIHLSTLEHHKVTLPEWFIVTVVLGSSFALLVCLGCFCYYAFFKKP